MLGNLLQVVPEFVGTLERSPELDDVVLAHAIEPLQAISLEGSDTSDDERPDGPIQARRTRQRVGATTRPTADQATLDAEMIENGSGVVDHGDDTTPCMAGGQSTSGPRVGDQPDVSFMCRTFHGSGYRLGTRGPMVEHHRNPGFRTADPHIHHPTAADVNPEIPHARRGYSNSTDPYSNSGIRDPPPYLPDNLRNRVAGPADAGTAALPKVPLMGSAQTSSTRRSERRFLESARTVGPLDSGWRG